MQDTCIRVRTPLSLQDARNIVADFVDHYNTGLLGVRLPSDLAFRDNRFYSTSFCRYSFCACGKFATASL